MEVIESKFERRNIFMADRSEKVIIFGVGKYWNFVRSFLTEGPQIVAYMDNCVKDENGGGGKTIFA